MCVFVSDVLLIRALSPFCRPLALTAKWHYRSTRPSSSCRRTAPATLGANKSQCQRERVVLVESPSPPLASLQSSTSLLRSTTLTSTDVATFSTLTSSSSTSSPATTSSFPSSSSSSSFSSAFPFPSSFSGCVRHATTRRVDSNAAAIMSSRKCSHHLWRLLYPALLAAAGSPTGVHNSLLLLFCCCSSSTSLYAFLLLTLPLSDDAVFAVVAV